MSIDYTVDVIFISNNQSVWIEDDEDEDDYDNENSEDDEIEEQVKLKGKERTSTGSTINKISKKLSNYHM